MGRCTLLILLLCLVTLSAVPAAIADYYKYTDSSGAVNITNKVDSVPAKYRSKMKVIKDEALSKKDPASQNQAQQPAAAQEESAAPQQAEAAAPAAVPEGKFAQLSARFPWFKPLVFLGVVLAVFVVLIKLTPMLPSPLLAKAIYLGFFVGVMVFLYKSYTEYMINESMAAKDKAVNMFKKSMVREAPADAETVPAPPVK